MSFETAVESEVVKFVQNGIRNIKELTAREMISESAINPYLVKALGITDFDSLARFYVYQRIGRSLVTSFGMTVMEKMVETLGEGKKGDWWDIEMVQDEKPLHISVKSGPRDMNKDQIVEFARRARILKEQNPAAVPLIAMCYGKEPLGPIASTLKKEGFDPTANTLTGKELYQTLTGEKGYHKKLMDLVGKAALRTLSDRKFIDIIEGRIREICEDFKTRYKTVDELLSDIF